MAPFTVPPVGLTLHVPSPDGSPQVKDGSIPPQVMRLDLADGVFEELLKSTRHARRGVHISFGKTITLQYGIKSRHLSATQPPSPSDLYTLASDNTNELAVAGRLSHTLSMQKAQQEISGADEALAKLQNSLASAKNAKQSNQIRYVPDSSSLPPPVKQTVASLRQQSSKANSLSFLKKHQNPAHLSPSTTHSMPPTPSLGASRASVSSKPTPTSAPALATGQSYRINALREPLIHLLAVRPVSAKFLAQKISATQDEVLQVLQKVAKPFRLDPSKWDLTDKAYKDLEVWRFRYPDQQDRQLAIDRAVSAFDRMRLSQGEWLWQTLYPKAARGKGKTLSKLNHLREGPIKQSTTPRIHVQKPEGTVDEGRVDGNESDQKDRHAHRDTEPMVRSKSNDEIKKTKISDEEAQSKRLLNKGPKKVSPVEKAKETHPAVKKGGKKIAVPKSEEFVNDSDEEDGLDAFEASYSPPKVDKAVPKPSNPGLEAKSAQITSNVKTSKSTNVVSNSDDGEGSEEPMDRSSSSSTGAASKTTKPSSASKPVRSSASATGTSSKVTKPAVSSQSASSTPAIKGVGSKAFKTSAAVAPSDASLKPKLAAMGHDKGKDASKHGVDGGKMSPGRSANIAATKTTPKPSPGSGAKPRTSDASPSSTATKQTLSRPRTLSSPRKPSLLGSSPPINAADFDSPAYPSASLTPPTAQSVNKTKSPNGVTLLINGHSRNNSDHSISLKRKAGSMVSGNQQNSSPLTNGHTDGYVSGYVRTAKRQKTSETSPPTPESTNPTFAPKSALEKAQDFKAYHEKYEKLYRAISQTKDAAPAEIERVKRMHYRLAEMKAEITKEVASG